VPQVAYLGEELHPAILREVLDNDIKIDDAAL
jgi:hypothetical protein